MDVLAAALDAEIRTERVHDPLGRPITASFALLRGGETAIVEMAQASGLARVAQDERDAWAASTYGTGEMIAAATRTGACRAAGVSVFRATPSSANRRAATPPR
jgi:glycerate kinase